VFLHKLDHPAGAAGTCLNWFGLTLTETQYEHSPPVGRPGPFDADWNAAWPGFPPRRLRWTMSPGQGQARKHDRRALEGAVGGSGEPGSKQ